MKIYLVGGAVRDKLLGQQPLDNDWVVVGATVAEMLTLGFQQVGKDFPVFLHPTTKEEYALARTERKSGHGYTAFTCIADPTVTLEQDLLRRDLTINAMAMDANDNLYDPYNGKEDLTKRILRHVSPSFIEDPLRVLRVARFAAKLAPHDFTIAPETMTLLQQMVAAKELAYLTPDRVWQEVVKSCSYERPEVFLQVLQQVGALAIIFSEWSELLAAPIDSNQQQLGELGITNLQMAAMQTDNLEIKLAILLVSASLSAQDNTKLQQQMILAICKRYPIANAVKDLALLVVNQQESVLNINELSATQILTVLEQLDAFRRVDRLAVIVLAISIVTNTAYEPLLTKWQDCLQICQSVAVQNIIAAGFEHAEISEQLRKQRIVKLQKMQQ